jgi:hypothetical protein
MSKKPGLLKILAVVASLIICNVVYTPVVIEAGTTQPGAEFKIQDLVVPVEVGAGDNIIISAAISNSASNDGNYEATLKVNGMPEATSIINVPPRGTRTASFTIVRSEPGAYEVDLDGLKGTILVVAKSAASNSGTIAGLPPLIFITIAVTLLVAAIMLAWFLNRKRVRRKHASG